MKDAQELQKQVRDSPLPSNWDKIFSTPSVR